MSRSKPTGKAAKKGTAKATSKATTSKRQGAVPPYGTVIRDAIARGNKAEMRKVAADARKHLSNVQRALKQLESAIGGLER